MKRLQFFYGFLFIHFLFAQQSISKVKVMTNDVAVGATGFTDWPYRGILKKEVNNWCDILTELTVGTGTDINIDWNISSIMLTGNIGFVKYPADYKDAWLPFRKFWIRLMTAMPTYAELLPILNMVIVSRPDQDKKSIGQHWRTWFVDVKFQTSQCE